MSTKLTGLDDLGFVTTAGDTGTLVTDGSLTIGNADTDNVVFNADIKSHIVPDQANTYDLGDPDKCWKDLHVGTRLYLHGNNTPWGIAVQWVDPPTQNVLLTVPAVDGTLAVEGLLPSYIAFGKNNAQTANLTNFELSTVNGSTNAMGWRLPVPGYVTHMSCQFDAATSGQQNGFLLTLWKNGVQQAGYDLSLNNVVSGDVGASLAFPTPLAFAANDTLTLKLTMTVGGGGSFSMDDLACLLRILN
jgi:hypothetical protein